MSLMDIQKIHHILPHRYPMLLVDRVVDLDPGVKIVAWKNVTINEPFFQGHFPGQPVMPGVLLVEAMAQAGGLLAYSKEEVDPTNKVIYLMGLDKVRFRRPIRPGDRVEICVETLRQKGGIFKQWATATVDGERAAEAELLAMARDRDEGATS